MREMKHQVLVCDDELAQAQSLAEMLERAIVIQDDERQGKLDFLGYYTCYEVTFVNSKFTHKNIPLMAYKNSRIRSFDSQPLCYSWIGYLRLMVRR